MTSYWLVKSEPDVFSFADLQKSPAATAAWDGVRNYGARNFLREMKEGDRVLFYHSGSNPPAVMGLAEVVRESYPDAAQFDPESPLFDPKASPQEPRWLAVDLRALRALPRPVSLGAIRAEPALSGMKLVQRGNRLSVMPVTEAEFARIVALGEGG